MTEPEQLDALDAKLASQIGDDVSVIFNHEYLFKQAREAITALRAEIARLTAERDRFEASLARACLLGGTTYLVERAEAAEAEVTRLRVVYRRLRSYAYHDDNCKLNKGPKFSGPCSCGLSEAIKGDEAWPRRINSMRWII